MVWWMFSPTGFVLLVLATIVSVAVLGVAYTAYVARVARERQAVVRPYMGPDPVEALKEANDEIARHARQAREAAASAREAVRHGVRG